MVTPLALSDPADERLEHSPLKLVVCQVRHDENFAVSDAARAVEIQQQLGDRYPQISSFDQSEFILTAGPGGANADTRPLQHGWQFKSDDELWAATLQTDYFSLETNAYVSWSDFRKRFEELMTAVIGGYTPKLEQRVGLRYVDEIEHPEAGGPYDWVGLIEAAFLGPLGDPELGPSARAAQQIVEFEGPEHTRVTLRYGCESLPSGKGTFYRLDHDCSRQRGRSFNGEEILATLDSLHTLALQVFQKAITPDLYRQLKGEAVPE